MKLEQRGLIHLPARRQAPTNRMRCRRQSAVCPAWDPRPIQCGLAELGPLQVSEVSGAAAERGWVAAALERFHYLGFGGPVGENLQYLLKEALGLLWDQPSRERMQAYLKEWRQWAMDSGVRQMQQAAKSLMFHARGILNWWDHRINNGRMEGINNKIKTLLRQTYGLRDELFFKLKLYSLHDSRQELLG